MPHIVVVELAPLFPTQQTVFLCYITVIHLLCQIDLQKMFVKISLIVLVKIAGVSLDINEILIVQPHWFYVFSILLTTCLALNGQSPQAPSCFT